MRISVRKIDGKTAMYLAQHIVAGASALNSEGALVSVLWIGNPLIMSRTGTTHVMIEGDIETVYQKIRHVSPSPTMLALMSPEGHRVFVRREDVTAYEEFEDATLLTFLPGMSENSNPHTLSVVETIDELTEMLDGPSTPTYVPGMGGPQQIELMETNTHG